VGSVCKKHDVAKRLVTLARKPKFEIEVVFEFI
jgi:hypothetical protein